MKYEDECREEQDLLAGKSLSRREFIKLAGIAGAVIGIGGGLSGLISACGGSSTTATSTVAGATVASTATTVAAAGAASGSLVFAKNKFTEATKTVPTADGDKEVTYRAYQHIAYVANPADANYQSLNVSVPVKIAGAAVDATNAPILFDIGVGGYMSVSNTGSGSTGGGAPTGAAGAGGGLPAGATPPSGAKGGGAGGMGGMVSNADLALAAGYVVVSPGCRGRDNVTSDGKYYGKAPAAIVDLKSAVRYVRSNKGVIPGNTDWIISNGTSAGGALSALLGASGDSDLYASYFKELGAADASDAIFGTAAYCPITDLDHADVAYEWMFGATPVGSTLVDQTLSKRLQEAFATYQASLKLQGDGGFGALTADNYADYLLKTYLVPAANKYVAALSDTDRATYLASNAWMTWAGNTASFKFADYAVHCGRMKGLPAFHDFKLTAAENILFGNETTDARHFTNFSLRQAGGDSSAEIDTDLKTTVNLMNPMHFIGQKNAGCANNFWIRYGTSDSNTSLAVIANLAASLSTQSKNANLLMYWDAGHGANEDSADFIKWVGTTTGYSK